jgi:dTDP-4-dehydrorhamnose 3,5-epimerase-like enzyme
MEPWKESIKLVVDDRGFLFQIFDESNDKITFDGLNYLGLPKIRRIYLVGNFSKDTIRGMHYHEKEWKYFFVIRGSAKFIVSPEDHPVEKTKTFILSERKPEVLIVPPKYYIGWKALEEGTLILGMSNFSLEESLKDDRRISVTSFLNLFKVENR